MWHKPKTISLPTNVTVPDDTPAVGGLPQTQTYVTGWRCPQCGACWSPWVVACANCTVMPRPFQPTYDCGCAPNAVCNNTVCPRRVQVTYSTYSTDSPFSKPDLEDRPSG